MILDPQVQLAQPAAQVQPVLLVRLDLRVKRQLCQGLLVLQVLLVPQALLDLPVLLERIQLLLAQQGRLDLPVLQVQPVLSLQWLVLQAHKA